jgi:Tat protein secretion system quality control protein TatD with DNase activity
MRNTLEFLAGLRRTGFEELESVTECNTRTLFRLNSNERT